MKQNFNKLQNLLLTHGIDPRDKLGQNFLIDLNILEIVFQAGELTPEDAVLEVGPGTGILTQRLITAAGYVLSVEIDPRFASLLKAQIAGNERFELHLGDILAGKNHIDPAVLAKLKAGMQKNGCTRLKLVANLPYSVATPVLTNLLIEDLKFERMVGMVQLEIAERFVALPGTSHYGGLAALVSNLSEARILRKIPPTVFFPRPKVDSAILELRPDYEKIQKVSARLGGFLTEITGPLALRFFLRDLFVHRRKSLRGALLGIPVVNSLSKVQIDQILGELNLPPEVRAEDLPSDQLLNLCEKWYAQGFIGSVSSK